MIQAEINQSQWGVGGDNRRIVEAGTALIQGLANGDVSRAVANASAPYLANEIAKAIPESNKSGRLAAHAIANVALALVKGENALSQAAGAVTAEAIGMLSGEIYGKDVSHLSEDEKTTLSAFASLAAGLAGGLAGGSTQDALNAGQAGKTTVENNSLSDIAQAQSEGKTLEQKAEEHVKAENERYKQENCAGMSAEACSAKMYDERREALKNTLSLGVDFVPVVGDFKSFVEAGSALEYLAAAVGILGPLGDAAGKAIKGAEKALKAGDLETASKLINKASDEIQAVKALDVGSYNNLKKKKLYIKMQQL